MQKSNLMLTMILIAVFLLPFGELGKGFAQTLQCSSYYGSANPDFANAVKQESDSIFIVAGYTNTNAGYWNTYLLKVDAFCNLLWETTLVNAISEKSFDLIIAKDAGYIMVGDAYNTTLSTLDALVTKTDSSGNLLWRKNIGGTNNELFYSIVENNDSSLVATGYTDTYGAGLSDFYIVKMDNDGNTLWQKTYGGTGKELAMSICKTNNKGYAVTGYTLSYGSGGKDFWLLRLNENGDTLWSKTYGGIQDDTGYEVQQTQDGGFIIAGYTTSFGNGGNALVVKTDSLGNLQWQKDYGGYYFDQLFSVKETTGGNYIMAGHTASSGNGMQDVWVVKINQYGDTLWTKTYGGTNDDQAEQAIITSTGNYVVVGNTKSFGNGLNDAYFLHISDTSTIANIQQTVLEQYNFSIYPNPSTGKVILTTTESSTIEIYNVLGEKILSSPIRGGREVALDLSGNPAGIYYYSIFKNGEIIHNGKLMIR